MEGRKLSKATKRAERAREQAQNLNARRRRRQIIRQMMIARADAASTAVSSGQGTGSSALQGAYAGYSQQGNDALAGVNQNQELGTEVFSANRQASNARTGIATGQAVTSLGGNIFQNREMITRVGQDTFGF